LNEIGKRSSLLVKDVNIKLVPVLSPQNESDVRTNAVSGEWPALYRGKQFFTLEVVSVGCSAFSRALI